MTRKRCSVSRVERLEVGSSMMRTRASHRKRLRDFHELLMADGERAHERVRIDLQSDGIEEFPRLAPLKGFVDEPAAEFLAAKEDVRGDVEIVGEIQLLMDERDAVRERVVDGTNRERATVEEDFAGVGPLHAGEDFHERALARPIFTDDGEHFAAGDRKAHAPERAHAGEGFDEGADFEKRRSRAVHASRSVITVPLPSGVV